MLRPRRRLRRPCGRVLGRVVMGPVLNSAIPVSIFPMSGNTLGTLFFTVTSFGESHGPAIRCVVDGCPPGLAISPADIRPGRPRPPQARHLAPRDAAPRAGYGRDPLRRVRRRPPGRRSAPDPQPDQRSKDYGNIAETFRPGTRTTCTRRNTASATTAAAAVRRRARPRCASRPARSRASGWPSATA